MMSLLKKYTPAFFFLWLMVAFSCQKDKKSPPPQNNANNANHNNQVEPLTGILVVVGPDVPRQPVVDVFRLLESRNGEEPVQWLESVPKTDRLSDNARLFVIGGEELPGIPDWELEDLDPEGYLVRTVNLPNGARIISIGSVPEASGRCGAIHGFLRLMEQAGFFFGHPLRPSVPDSVNLHLVTLDARSSPRWTHRGIHLHTMHPTELVRVLNGWGLTSPEDQEGFDAQLPWWRSVLLWSLANGLNHIHWVLLENEGWGDFSRSTLRQQRLRQLVDIAHEYAMRVGVDAPMAFAQQNAFRLIREEGTPEERKQQMFESVDFLMEAGFDYLMTEAGESEFTHGDPGEALDGYNALSEYLDETWGAPVWIKVHCSTNQSVEGWPDPRTGEDINFNFLVHYADPRMGALPHTVQHYTMDDPAPTYGNTDFTYIRDFLYYETGRRSVVWYPETSYWVSFDVDVPLFLPVYALNRYRDLWTIAMAEEAGQVGYHEPTRMDGQFFFSSGWDWGYWLNDVVAARASWNVHLAVDPVEGFRGMLRDELHFPADAADFLVEYAVFQHRSLILGAINDSMPPVVELNNGQAYLQGWETWDDITKTGSSHMPDAFQMTQPDRIGLVETKSQNHGYNQWADPLLAHLATRFGAFLGAWNNGAVFDGPAPHDFTREVMDMDSGLRMNHLRAIQIHGLYDYADSWKEDPLKLNQTLQTWRAQRLNEARGALDQAGQIVEKEILRAPVPLVYEWGSNPTAYGFNYLWTVKSLYYWWRDEGKAVDAPLSPCYLNIMDAAEIAGNDAVSSAQALFSSLSWLGSIDACLSAPSSEPLFPQDDLRSRP